MDKIKYRAIGSKSYFGIVDCHGYLHFILLFLYIFLYRESFHSLKIASLFGSIISVFLLFGCWSLIYFAWGNVEKNRNNVIHQLTLESTMKDLEIKTIRSNLQPHFIFNALNSIRALIDENPGQAREAITHISNILRNSITKQEPTDTLANELSLVDDYLALEKYDLKKDYI